PFARRRPQLSTLFPYTTLFRSDFACFTRPEMKVERVSYDVMTPSAARAVFEAILWKPAIRWRVRRIEVLRPIRWISLRRNEVARSEEHTSELQSRENLVCRLLL